MSKLKYYIKSFRLRTLPLSVSGILTGIFLASASGYFNIWIFVTAITTTLCLQILSNVSNEYGDSMNGVDNDSRIGPVRALQPGGLTLKNLKQMIILFILLSLVSGICLIISSFGTLFCVGGWIMLALGVIAIVAAVKYTVGKNNYGYKGLGDIAVFIFFGWVSTAGVYYLATHTLVLSIFLPASAIGMLSMGVLNVNNIRDRENDKEYGKNTLVVKMGEHKAKIYHLFLISGAWCLLFLYSLLHNKGITGWIYLLVLPMFVFHLIVVYRSSGRKLDVQLRNLSLMTLLLTVLFGISLII